MKTLVLALSLVSSAALAANAGDADLLRCLAIAEGPARLVCYDGLATAVRDAKVALPTATAAAAQNFGRPPAPAAQPEEAKVLESRIDGSLSGWQRDAQIRLVNGQVWQIGGDTAAFAPLSNPKVFIRPGLFGSYFLEVEGLSFQVRVKRLQ